MKKFLLILFILLFVANVNTFANNKRGRTKAAKKSTTTKRWNHNRKTFKMKPSNSYLSNERKNVVLKRMY